MTIQIKNGDVLIKIQCRNIEMNTSNLKKAYIDAHGL